MADPEIHESAAWIDIHAHVAPLAGAGGVSALVHGAGQGVGTIVDAGSAPPAQLAELLATANRDSRTTVLAWANICAEGIAGRDCTGHDISGTSAAAALRALPGQVVGIKLQASNTRLAGRGLEAIENAKSVAAEFGVPLMVHVGNGPPTIRQVVAALRPGDIVTHFAHGKPAGALEEDDPHPSLVEARGRGVLFDVGHGAGSFSFPVMERLVAAGFLPDIISTDLHRGSAERPVGSLADCMSKMLGLGMPLADVLAAVTERPRLALHLPPTACRTRYLLVDDPWTGEDSYGERRPFRSRFRPIAVIDDAE